MTKIQREKLEELAAYILPTWKFARAEGDMQPYVKLETAEYLRQLGREVLALEKQK